ncbi:hypothetical protein N7532_004845 [Penicillium argentinense]|uniref:Zn(2)-C6 fungal-type domain-containing protein n=1 Tax=Penicillium argentinense TaxID=1131581 RepID=A0A9W9K996_9EURO|nr:uncharacterized protein N7532_004845 [Penicillium argentinense]KAJ5097844.1 hypothetical protein N7532_004845 [Penicillium argentinense]
MTGSKSSVQERIEVPPSPASLFGEIALSKHSPQPTSFLAVSDNIGCPESQSTEKSSSALSSSFRNVSACNRCRLRKHRCDQQLPRCRSCEKAHVRCVGYDPVTKQEIPRSYVYFLENRIKYLKTTLEKHQIDFKPPAAFDDEATSEPQAANLFSPTLKSENSGSTSNQPAEKKDGPELMQPLDSIILDLLSGKDAKFAITKMDAGCSTAFTNPTSIRTSFFGFYGERSTHAFVELPARDEAERLVEQYFIRTNLQLPVLHREEFETLVDHIYSVPSKDHQTNQLYFLFIILAIGSASERRSGEFSYSTQLHYDWPTAGSRKRKRSAECVRTPEEYHASAMVCLEGSLNSSSSLDRFSDYEELQAMILLCSFALFEPVTPGLGSLVEIIIRSAVDLRLYSEQDTASFTRELPETQSANGVHQDWVDDLRRRLWWCVYSLDRLIAPYLGRPFFIPDDVVTTLFPSTLDDRFITRHGILASSENRNGYKHAAQHYLRLRILQSEIHSVLQHQQALAKRERHSGQQNLNQKPSTFLRDFSSFTSWQRDVSARLDEWKDTMPTLEHQSDRLALELDFWQTMLLLYRWSIKIPSELVRNPSTINANLQQLLPDTPRDLDWAHFKVAEASSKALHIYRLLQNFGLITSFYLATHQIFIAGKPLIKPCLRGF